ncbi:MAG TPA: cytochrome c [Candidatus Acidoferrales bacterium]|nr:cytochrome c [Candidatus Acidoferrales bacterium]
MGLIAPTYDEMSGNQMRKKTVQHLALLLVGIVFVGASFATLFDLSAVPDPGRLETFAANEAKNWLVYRESRSVRSKETPTTPADLDNAQMIFGSECSDCHGDDGRKPTDIGRGLYPRAPDLGSAEVQNWSDREMFWIIRNGIRLSGMPAFGKELSDQETWGLVHYVKSLRQQARTAS